MVPSIRQSQGGLPNETIRLLDAGLAGQPVKASVRRPNPSQEFWTPERCFILETWNDVSDGVVSVARARVEPGITTQLHALEGIVERYLVVEGRGRVEVAGEAPTPVEAGDLVFIPAGASQRITNTGGSDLVFYCICTPPFVPDAYIDLESPAE